MKLHLRADSVNEAHVRFTVFMNGANCGQLCMTDDEARFFHDVIITTKYKLPEDEVYSSGQWFLEEKKQDKKEGEIMDTIDFQGEARPASYLGDGVYAIHDGHGIWLHTNDHENPTDKIYLESFVLEELNNFIKDLNQQVRKDGE